MGGIKLWKYKYGDYVRTSNGRIGKLIRVEFDRVDKSLKWYVFLGKDEFGIEKEIHINKPYILKHSKNIIDLIEVKDVVKFRNKLPNSLEDEEMIIHIFNNDTLEEVKEAINSKEIEIVSIVTHQSFKQVEYEV